MIYSMFFCILLTKVQFLEKVISKIFKTKKFLKIYKISINSSENMSHDKKFLNFYIYFFSTEHKINTLIKFMQIYFIINNN